MFKQLIPLTVLLLLPGCQDDNKTDIDSCGGVTSYSTKYDITDVAIEVLIVSEINTYPSMTYGDRYKENTEVAYSDIIFSLISETQIVAVDSKKKVNKGKVLTIW